MKIKPPNELPHGRLRYFWSEIDRDNSGSVLFEEFLQWWLKYFDSYADKATMPFESFYSQVRRMGPMYQDPLIQPLLAEQEEEELKLEGEGTTATPRRTTLKRGARFLSMAKKVQRALENPLGADFGPAASEQSE